MSTVDDRPRDLLIRTLRCKIVRASGSKLLLDLSYHLLNRRVDDSCLKPLRLLRR